MMDRAFDDVAAVLREQQDAVARATSPTTPRTTAAPAAIRTLVNQFVRSILSVQLRVPGSHYSGLSNQALLEVRVREGRDFDQWTVQAKQRIERKLVAKYRDRGRLPSVAEIEADASEEFVAIVKERVERGGLDIKLEKLSKAYAVRKRKEGYGSKPIGVLRGRWLASLDRAFAIFKR